MPSIDQAIVQGFIDVGVNGTTTSQQGKALEDLVCYVFGLVPGISITHRNELNVFDTEEIDVALWNEGNGGGLHFLPQIILLECKNWSGRVGSDEVSWFQRKLHDRGLDFGILICTKGVTGNARDLKAAHSIIAGALRDRCRLLVLTTDEIGQLMDTDQLATLIKRKLCDLAVKGTL